MGAILDILLKRPIMGPILRIFFKPAEVKRRIYTKEQRRTYFSGLYGPAAAGKKNWPSKGDLEGSRQGLHVEAAPDHGHVAP
jgi:hypothetical protein